MIKENREDNSFVKPTDYPIDRLKRERLALVKCVNNEPFVNYRGVAFYPQIGKYYTAISINRDFRNLHKVEIKLTNGRRLGCSYPGFDFTVARDPGCILSGINSLGCNIYLWRQAKKKLVDKNHNIVSDEWLKEHSLALVQYPNDSEPTDLLIPGRQYYALSFPYDGLEVYVGEGLENGDCYLFSYDAFDILSDPLGVLDYRREDYDEVIKKQRQIHFDLFPKNDRTEAEINILANINDRLDNEVFSQLALSAEMIEKIKSGYERIIVDVLKEAGI